MKNSQNSRFENYSRNIFFAIISQIVIVAFAFIGRKVFLSVLDVQYLGLSSLFSSILVVLSLAELGIGTSIIYSLYKPIEENNQQMIISLMQLFKKTYISVGVFIIIAGTTLIPFLEYFVKEIPDIAHIELIYFIFVLQTAIPYFFSHKINFLTALQKNYVVQLFNMIATIVQVSIQIVVLIVFKNYYIYISVAVLIPLLVNIIATIFVNRNFSYLKSKAIPLGDKDLSVIKKNIFAMILYKISSTLSATIDTIFISRFMGLIEVGIYSNYHFVISFSDRLFTMVLGTITPSLGNFMVSNTNDQKVKLFNTLQLVYYWIGTYLAVGLIVLFNPLINIWLGKEFLFPQEIVVALVISITLTNFQRPCSLIRDSNGLFWHGKLRPLAMSIINIVASLVLINIYGTIGVIIGTILSKILTYVWYDPYIVYKYAISSNIKKYFTKYFVQWIILLSLSIICYRVFNNIMVEGIGGLAIGILLVTTIVNGSFFLLYRRSSEFTYLTSLARRAQRKRKNN